MLTPGGREELQAARRDYLRQHPTTKPWHPTAVEEEVCADLHDGTCPHTEAWLTEQPHA